MISRAAGRSLVFWRLFFLTYHLILLCEIPTNWVGRNMIVISPKACLMLIFKKVLRAGCDEESTVFHVGEELLEGLLAGAA